MFGSHFEKVEDGIPEKYNKKAKGLIYTPKQKPPNILELCDKTKSFNLVKEIKSCDSISDAEKDFLILAAQRHNGFLYSKIADYYSHASPQMQEMMEKSALVIIDFDKAIAHGFVRLSEKTAQHYTDESSQ